MKKILSIDDEPAILKCFGDALKSQGYEVFLTGDPDDGLRILKENPDIDLLLLDIKMPGKSGFDVYREFRRFRDVPVLFVTAYPRSFNAASEEVTHMWQEQFVDGVTDILYKPFDLDTFFEKVKGLIGEADDGGEDA
jgi:DNA-binding response OmpR family regulator